MIALRGLLSCAATQGLWLCATAHGLPSSVATQGAPRNAPEGPPGMVWIPGGRTRIGIEQKELEHLLAADPNSQNYAGALSAETPAHELAVDSFFLMTTEVTNEQYAAFVRASGARPPESWGEEALHRGAEDFFREEERAKIEALAQGLPIPEPAQFDRRAWWDANWRTASWKIPQGDELLPVTFVDYAMARAYCRWAGMRLPSEFEVERAARGDSARRYPWGNEWDSEKYAATSLLKKKGGPYAVASFPLGATKQGVFDLAGNVWEWSSSPYIAFPAYDRHVYQFGYGTQVRNVTAYASFDDTHRVVTGGSFQNGSLMCRATTRRSTDPKERADALGFRCAMQRRLGVDVASTVMEDELTANMLPRDGEDAVTFAPDAAAAAMAWSSEPGTSGAPAGYAVISGEKHVVFTPVRQLRASDPASFERLCTSEAMVTLGFLTTNVPLVDPELPAGTYLVFYRARGLPRFLNEDEHPTSGAKLDLHAQDALRIDVQYDHLVFVDTKNQPLRAVRCKVEYGLLHECRLSALDPEPVTESGTPERKLHLEAGIACRTTLKGFLFNYDLRLEPAAIDVAWRTEGAKPK